MKLEGDEMAKRKYQVRFARPVVGKYAESFSVPLAGLATEHGKHLPARDLSGERYQVRDLRMVGLVWMGTFGKLRDDAPHLVNIQDEERELVLDEGDRLLEKCHFMYRLPGNLLVWQLNRGAGGMTRFEDYMSNLLGEVVSVPAISNEGADSSTKRNKDEPGDGWLRMPRHHDRSNRQVQVARCTSTSAEKNDTKSTVS